MSHTEPRQTTNSTTNKLRDSCHACALSKVKCHKEKPTCSRCARKSITCEYFVTKRPGRKLSNKHSITATTTTAANSNNKSSRDNRGPTNVERLACQTTSGSWPGSTDSPSDAMLSMADDNLWTALGLTPVSMSPMHRMTVTGVESSSSSSENLTDFSLPVEAALAEMSNEFDDFLSSPIDCLELEALDTDSLMQGANTFSNHLIPDDASSDSIQRAPSIVCPNTHANKPASPSSNSQAQSTTPTQIICCLMQALNLLKPSSTALPACPVSENATTPSNNIIHGCYRSAQTVVTENQQTIEAVNKMLQCPCAEDNYLLVNLSMIVFQVLRRYAAAAQNQFGGTAETGGSTPTNEHGVERMAAQLILSELHRVQHLVNQLSPRLNPEGAAAAASRDGKTMKEFFSPTTLTQIGIDLRKYLTAVSSVIIGRLRQF